MDLSALTRFRLRRVNPYPGLIIDADTWTEAHDYHRDHMRLHAIAFHGAGQIAGLEVRPTPSQAGSVDIGAGAAIDAEGNIIIVGQDRRVSFDGVEPGDVYVVISYLENRVNSTGATSRDAPMNRIVESYKIEVQNKPAENTELELARIRWSATDAAVRQAADAANPVVDEIDTRYRLICGVARPTAINVGVVLGESAAKHTRGITNLMREIDSIAGYQSRFRGNVNLEDGTGGSDFLYVCAPIAGETATTSIASHLSRGGTFLAENCAGGEGNAFTQSMQQLADRLGLKLKPIDSADPLLDMRYPFAEVPVGADEGAVVSSGRFVLSQRDYGCAWSGTGEKKALPRETVRTALEWGVNLAIASVQSPGRPV